MPTITLIAPDGRTITLTPPDAATPDELQGVVDQVIASHGISREQRLEMLKTAPGPAAPGFFEKFGSELAAAGEEAAQALARPGLRSSLPLVASPTEIEQAVNVEPGLLGAAGRALNAPFVATGAAAGRAALGATGSPGAATAADIAAQIGSGALIGAASRGLVRGAQRILPRLLPGASGALLEQQMVEARRLPAQYAPTAPSETLYSIADSLNPNVTELPRLHEVAKAIAAREKRLAKPGLAKRRTWKIAQRISDTLERGPERVVTAEVEPSAANRYVQAPGSAYGITEVRTQDIPTLSFQEVRDWLRRLGDRINELRDPMRRSTGGVELDAAKKMYGSLLTDLEKSAEQAVGPAAHALKAANLAAKREFATKELGDIIESGIKRVQGSDLPENVNFGTILNNLKKEVRKNELFVQAFTEGELDAIEGALEQARKLPVAAPPRGASVGSSLQARRVGFGGALGAMVGGYAGGWQGSVIGGTIGSFGGLAVSNAISSALMSETGRRFLVAAVRADPSMLLSARGLAMLSAAARAGAAGNGSPE